MHTTPFKASSIAWTSIKTGFAHFSTFLRIALPSLLFALLDIWFESQGKNSLSTIFKILFYFTLVLFSITSIRFAAGKPLAKNITGLSTGGVFWKYLTASIKVGSLSVLVAFVTFGLAAVLSGTTSKILSTNPDNLLNFPLIILFPIAALIVFYIVCRISIAPIAAICEEDSTIKKAWNLTYKRVWFLVKAGTLNILITASFFLTSFLFVVILFMATNSLKTEQSLEKAQEKPLSIQQKTGPFNMPNIADQPTESSAIKEHPLETVINVFSSFLMFLAMLFSNFIYFIISTRVYLILRKNPYKEQKKT